MTRPLALIIFLVAILTNTDPSRSDAGSDPVNYLFRGPVTAVAAIAGEGEHAGIKGSLTFLQKSLDGRTVINGTISGLPEGKHGLHIVDSGDMTKGCYITTAKGHLNPFNLSHGAPSDSARHVGDLGNIYADDTGISVINLTDTVISLFPTPAFVIGRILVIHTTYDDLGRGGSPVSKVNGNAGGRLACGIISYV
ncbi:SOD_CuZN15 [Ramazzottius varieornatus]|uniref:Superoxide dismutase [Cu-Zn] n=1 Tax=Ramazzottius varieornatus TaxID=947166 RepID=SODC_RAMVA|nr:Chain A, Superoxide dismutase [Cu-Zn] [Ramazzottius varieornatus]7YPP_B Chain B, Superoxide dismutase [Cu-Zn] [Ramazzottius varieornatus]7YPP_C Chain C, Superoxide dismutase [Cu-Zn] [Ramazzottius varieornatus]7YPP_D Chain D, Superoxide dismutase [Cu-Zn] [Ramazzottius varieornatus]7YPP_E Chain E, Superoxide dismutase [Cu-Zn] [Ramazzottius varieornatus]7YPP_F Chain F, Superoxide dismutase [Cu-Zn] [Ramazzottius varieornatus]GAV02514.1 SOD_CuZN15 [Ramazzottius varieornatus]